MTTVCPLILYLQSSKATLEDIVIVKTWKNKEHVQQQNCCHDASIHCRVTTIYIGKWMINIIHYNSKLPGTYSWYIMNIHEVSDDILHHWYHFLYDKKLYETYLSTSHKTIQLYNKLSTANTLILCNTLEMKKVNKLH